MRSKSIKITLICFDQNLCIVLSTQVVVIVSFKIRFLNDLMTKNNDILFYQLTTFQTISEQKLK